MNEVAELRAGKESPSGLDSAILRKKLTIVDYTRSNQQLCLPEGAAPGTRKSCGVGFI